MDFIITKDYVKVINEDIRKKLDDKLLSASTINSIINSPGNFILDTYVEDLCKKKESIHIARGHWFHSLMEEFFNNPNKNINDLVLKDLINVSNNNPKYSQQQKSDDIIKFKDLFNNGSDFYWMKECIKGFYKINKKENYDKRKTLGSEKEYISEINGLKIKAIIDTIFEYEDGVEIVDWKTGNYHKMNEDYHFQQALYSLILENEGVKVNKASLAYVKAGIIEDVDINNKEYVINKINTANKLFDEYKNNDYTFPFKEYEYDGWRKLLFDIGQGPKPDIYKRELYKYAKVLNKERN